MEDLEQDVPQEVKLVVTEEMRSYIYEITKWSKFLSIIGFILSALLILGSLSIGAAVNANPAMLNQLGPLASIGGIGLTIMYFVIALIYFYPSLLLFRFSNKGKHAVLYGEQESLNEAMLNMKSLFKFWGIMTIAIIFLYFLMIFIVGASLAMK
ncbi:hypothetical protein DHW03_17880 [Pedobacter yonginense]|uniref:DUF5362 domain-containing protein n=1 Tax=Pedobacter yonginense TaxID=651869 RepID=A0A317EN29_9SPHI|nr:DUF5362 family protein [Pedobacter yonginense]PWS26686.1 hypothetical protein DHW03_17880 [Pedobacter yonginense]